ncbi:MAG: hypothetical protein IJQ50_02790, partial [Clostridia bacterium]|nr:hypothetical protein [Clostridia bacterium]
VYNSIDNNTKEIYKPLSFNNYQVYDYSIQTSFDSKVYIKTDDYDEQKDSVYVCYYDSDEKLLGVFPLKAKNYGNYLECDFIPIVTAFPYYTKVMFWKDNIVPMCKSLCFQ